jgi:hypothetical protein
MVVNIVTNQQVMGIIFLTTNDNFRKRLITQGPYPPNGSSGQTNRRSGGYLSKMPIPSKGEKKTRDNVEPPPAAVLLQGWASGQERLLCISFI